VAKPQYLSLLIPNFQFKLDFLTIMAHAIINEFKNKKILLCFPHPDDEIYISGYLLQEFVKNNIEFTILCLSHGGAGKNYSYKKGDLKEIRKEEFYTALSYIGIHHSKATIIDFEDGTMKNNFQEIKNYLENFLQTNKFESIITFDNTGITGHPDHISLSKIFFEISKYHNIAVFVPTLTNFGKLAHIKSKKTKFLNKPTHEIKSDFVMRIKKYKALLHHTSQFNTLSFKFKLLFIFFTNKELFHKIDTQKSYNYSYTDFKI